MSISPFNWLRDAFGIRKDLIDAEKSKRELPKVNLEVEKLEAEKHKRESQIEIATFAQVKQYNSQMCVKCGMLLNNGQLCPYCSKSGPEYASSDPQKRARGSGGCLVSISNVLFYLFVFIFLVLFI